LAHYRYTKKKGKIYGPYLYENKRVGGKVVSHYVGKSDESENGSNGFNWNILIIISLLLVVLLAIFVINKGITGNVILNLDEVNQNYVLGQNLAGHFSFSIQKNLISSSVLSINIGSQTKEISVNSLVDSSSSLIYPDVDFNLILTSLVSNETLPGSTTENESLGGGSGEAEQTGYGGITGNVVLGDNQNIVSGSAKKGSDFTYSLNGKSAAIEVGSVKYNGQEIGDDKISLNVNEDNAVVSTVYSTLADEITVEIDLSALNLAAENGVLTAVLVRGDERENVLEKEIIVSNESNALNETNLIIVNETINNETIINETFTNETIANQTIVNETIITNITNLAFVGNIPSIRIQVNGSYELSLGRYFDNAERYEFFASNITGIVDKGVLTITPDADFRGSRKGIVIAYSGNESRESNQFNILVGGIKFDVSHGNITLGERVKWTADVSLESNESAVVKFPKEAENITVNDIEMIVDEATGEVIVVQDSGFGLTGNVIDDFANNGKGLLTRLFEWLGMLRLTGNVVDDADKDNNKDGEKQNGADKEKDKQNEDSEVVLNESVQNVTDNIIENTSSVNNESEIINEVITELTNVSDVEVILVNESVYETEESIQEINLNAGNESLDLVLNISRNYSIEYYTDAPIASEENTSYGKKVVISGLDLNYTNVLSFVNVSEMVDVGDEGGIKIYWAENQSYVPFDAYDLNDNGKIDYIEWITPHLSNQTFYIILIVKAEHLDENRTLIEDVYEQVKAQDNVSVNIPSGDYLRVRFEIPIDSSRDITIYAKSNYSLSNVEVYEINGNVSVARFENITSSKFYKVYLTSLNGSQDTFDLRVSGSVDFDYVVDPAGPSIYFVSPTPVNASYYNSATAQINVSSDMNVSACLLNWPTTSVYGTGADGNITITAANTIVNNYTFLSTNVTSGSTTITVNSTSAFSAGNQILIVQMQNYSAGNAGDYEFATISSVNGNNLVLASGLTNSYFSGVFNSTNALSTQIVKVPQYTNISVNSAASIVPAAWDGYKGGIVSFRATGMINVTGSVNATAKGYRGGAGASIAVSTSGQQGESTSGWGKGPETTNTQDDTSIWNANPIGGGGGGGATANNPTDTVGGGGGGGGYGTNGTNCSYTAYTSKCGLLGSAYGSANLTQIYLGSGGGAGGADNAGVNTAGVGGAGGGLIYLYGSNVIVSGSVTSNGQKGANGAGSGEEAGGGGGAGGSILLYGDNLTLGSSVVAASGATGGSNTWSTANSNGDIGGTGGSGRIRIDFNVSTGATNPASYNSTINSGGGSTINYVMQVNNGDANTWANYTLLGLADTSFSYSATCNDSSNNLNTTEIRVFTVDATNPVAGFTSQTDSNNAFFAKTDIVINATITDTNPANITVRLYNATQLLYTNYSANPATSYFINYTGLSDGAYYFNATAYDLAGNVEDSETRMVTIYSGNVTVSFASPSYDATTYINRNWAYANLSVVGINSYYTFVDFDRSVVLWLRMDDVNSSGGSTDISSYSINGSNIGNAAQITSGAFGKGFAFDGTGDGISFAQNPTLNMTSKTFSFWANVSAYKDYDTIFNDANDDFTGFRSAGNGMIMYWRNAAGSSKSWLVSYNQAPVNTWQHYSIVYNISGLNVNISLYMNATLIGSTSATDGYKSYPIVRIGDFLTAGANSLNGALDEFIIFNRSLSVQEIQSLFNSGTYKYQNNFTDLSSGTHTLQGFVVDAANQRNDTGLKILITDLINPGVNFTDPVELNGSVYTRSNIQVNVSMTDTNPGNITIRLYNLSGIIYSNYSSNGVESYFINYTGLGDGNYTFNATAYDLAGNFNNTESRSVSIHSTPPTINITSPANTTYATNNITINFTSSDTFAVSARWFSNGTGNTTYTDVVYQIVGEGTNTFIFYSNDSANNLNTTSVQFFVDITPPVINLTSPINQTYNMNNITINFTSSDALSSISSRWFSNGTGNTTYTDVVYQIVGEGTNTFIFYSNDSVGNINSTANIFTVDTTYPSISFTYPTPSSGSLQSGNSIYANLSTSDTNQHYSFVDFDNSLMLWYRMDDINGSLGVTDLSSYSNNGSSYNGSVQNDSGKFGKAMQFDGSNDYILTDSSTISLSRLTLCAWINIGASNTVNSNNMIVSKYDGGVAKRVFGLWQTINTNVVTFTTSPTGAYIAGNTLSTSSSLFDGNWHQVCGIHNGTYNFLYVDGALNNSATATSGIYSTSLPITIACSRVSGACQGNDYFNGLIDEVLIFNRSLSAGEISSLYNAQIIQYENNFTLLSSANHTLKGYAVDIAGNLNSTSISAIVDTIAPIINITSPINQTYNMNNITINFTSSDALSSIDGKWFFNGTGNTTYTDVVYQIVGEGTNTFIFYSNDSANNLNTTSVQFFIDSVYPTISTVYPLNLTYSYVIDQLNYTTFDLNIQSCGYSTDNGITNTSVACGQNITGLSSTQGTNNWLVYSNDTTGNLNSSYMQFFTDTLIPGVNFTNPTPASGSTQSANSIYANLSSNDTNQHYSFVDFDNSLMSWYRMDDVDGSGNPIDLSVYSNNGIAFNGAVQNISGVFGKSFSFDGVNDYVNTSNVINSSSFSVGVWFKASSLKASANILNNGYHTGEINNSWQIRLGASNPGTLIFAMGNGTANAGVGTTTFLVIKDVWEHAVITYNFSTGAGNIYYNGLLNYSGLFKGMILSSDSLKIGSDSSYVNNFNGSIDDVLIFNRILSAGEVASLYNAQANQYSNNFTSLSSTNHTFIGYAVDMAGNKNQTETRNILIDTIAPIINITSPLNQTYNINNITINFTSSDALSSIDGKWFFNGTGNTTYTDVVYQIVGEGTNTFIFYSNDSANNLNTTSVQFFVDSVYPTISTVYPLNLTYSYVIDQLNYTTFDLNIQSCGYSTDNGITNTSVICGHNVTGLSSTQGTNNWIIYANDTAGNLNSSSVQFFVDTLIPGVNFTNPTETNGTYLNRNNIQVNATISDANPANITIRFYNLSGLMYTNVSTTGALSYFVNYTELSDGNYTFNSTVTDLLNNMNSSETRKIIIDTVNPGIDYDALSDANGSNLFRGNIVVNVTISDLYPKNITIRLYNDTSLLSSSTSSLGVVSHFANFTGLDDQTYYFNATVFDLAGNRNDSQPRTLNVVLDYVPPSINFTGLTDDTGYQDRNNINVNVSVNDKHLANLTILLFNSTSIVNTTLFLTNGVYALNYTNLPDGRYYLNASAVDLSVNVNWTETRNITIDTTTPLISYGSNVEVNVANVSRNWIFANLSVIETNEANTSFNLYNSTEALINSSVFTGQKIMNWTSLSDGVYYYNATITDLVNKMNSTETRKIILDATAPNISLFNSTANVLNSSIANITLNASDATSGLSVGVFELVYPNGTALNYTPSSSNGLYNLSINLTVIGDYIARGYVNDSAGNIANASTSFEVYIPLNISGSIVDALGNLRNYTFAFYSPGTSTPKYNFTGSNYSSSELHLREYDVIITTDNSHKIVLYNLTMNQSTIPVQIDNFSSASLTNNKVLIGLGINSTFQGTGFLNISYIGLFNAEISAINESQLQVYKCSNWSYSSRTCSGDYENYSNYTIDSANDRAIVNVSSFSSYILSERTCGNSLCQASYGETLATCPGDCTPGSTPSTPSSSSGGGGGGGATTVKTSAGLQFSMLKIERQVAMGDSVTENLNIDNTLGSDMTVTLKVSDSLKSLIFVNETAVVKAASSATIPILIIGTTSGVYMGDISLETRTKNYTIPVTILVTGKSDRLLDLNIVLGQKSVNAGDDLDFTISAFNLGKLQRYDIMLDYSVQKKDSNATIAGNGESFAIETSLSLARKLNIPSSTKNGDYVLILKASYGDDQTAIASANFKVGKEGVLGVGGSTLSSYLSIISALALLIVLVGGSIYYFVTIRQKLFEKKMEEIKKNSIYVFPDFKLLPQSKFAYIGLVADTDVKTYLDYTQLNRHTLIAGGTGSGKTVAGMVVVEELVKRGTNVIVLDPVGQWTGFANKNNDKIMSNKYKKFGISSPKAFPISVIPITKECLNLDISAYMNRKGLVVFNMNKLSPKDIDSFVEQCLRRVYTLNLSETSSLRNMIVLDEVHRILPKYGGKKAYVRLEQAVREFRKWGVGLLMISQVLTDFKGAIRGNIGTEVQLQTRYEGDIKRVRERSGSKISRLVSKMPVGLGIVECPSYNHGAPYFVEFRPLLHSPFKLSDAEIAKFTKKEKPVLNAAEIIKKDKVAEAPGKKEEHHSSAHKPVHHGKK